MGHRESDSSSSFSVSDVFGAIFVVLLLLAVWQFFSHAESIVGAKGEKLNQWKMTISQALKPSETQDKKRAKRKQDNSREVVTDALPAPLASEPSKVVQDQAPGIASNPAQGQGAQPDKEAVRKPKSRRERLAAESQTQEQGSRSKQLRRGENVAPTNAKSAATTAANSTGTKGVIATTGDSKSATAIQKF